MKERPILFSGSMVRAVLEGRKSQTRRMVKPQPPEFLHAIWKRYPNQKSSPYGEPGDRLWVRETFYCDYYRYPEGPVEELKTALHYRASHDCNDWEDGCPCSDDEGHGSWLPSIHMPRWASRITLEITGVRVERLQDISKEDALAEGIQVLPLQSVDDPSAWYQSSAGVHQERSAQASYRALWDSINGAKSWQSNPWVWVICFRDLK